MIDEGRMKKKRLNYSGKLGMTVNLEQPMKNMSVSQRQMCEIAKAISYNSKGYSIDELAITYGTEVEKLFQMMRMLAPGISLHLYFSQDG